MPRPTFVNCAFDPSQCPLLQGLSPDEQKQRMDSDPIIRACVRSVEAGGSYPGHCSSKAAAAEPADAASGKARAGKARAGKAARPATRKRPARSGIAAGA